MKLGNRQAIADLGIIIAAGGSGSRFSPDKSESKLFARLSSGDSAKFADMPLFMYSVMNFIGLCPDNQFVLVVKKEDRAKFAEILAEYLPGHAPVIVEGGRTRMHSVYNGLTALPESAKFAAVHDAARPFADAALLSGCLEAARRYGGAIVAKRMTDTVKRADAEGFVVETVDRSLLWSVETPQIFPTDQLAAAYEKAFADNIESTDDAGVMEYVGYQPYLFEHTGDNRKITYPDDIRAS
jgi:2-C-methyl-D-erythritol 4-phosphate cytidylyltransferase